MRLLAVAVLVACGSARSGGGQPPRSVSDGPATGSGTPVTDDGRRTDQECDALLVHALALELATRPAEQTLDETERAQMMVQLRQRHGARCRELPSTTYRCFMDAPTLAALQSCEERDQRTFKSSTSNSSVAFGGMTPAAPRSP